MNKISDFVFYLTFAVTYTYTVIDNLVYVDFIFNVDKTIISKLKCLTIWNAILIAIYFIIGSIDSFIKLFNCKKKNKKPIIFSRLVDALYTALVFPIGNLVVISFWAIYHIDRELIFPTALDSMFPAWQNHVLHSLPIVTNLLDMYLIDHQYNSSFQKGIMPLVFMSLSCVSVIYYFGYAYNKWLYPILAVIGSIYRILLIFGLLGLTIIVYKIGEIMNSILWHQQSATKSKRS